MRDDFFGDGLIDATTQPLSTYKENIINENTRWLTENRTRMTFNINNEDREMGGVGWSSPFFTETIILPNDKKIRIYMNGEVTHREFSVTPSIRARLFLIRSPSTDRRVIYGPEFDWSALGTTFGGDFYEGEYFCELDTSVLNLGASINARVGIEIRSVSTEDDPQLFFFNSVELLRNTGYGLFTKPNTSDLPNSVIDEGIYARWRVRDTNISNPTTLRVFYQDILCRTNFASNEGNSFEALLPVITRNNDVIQNNNAVNQFKGAFVPEAGVSLGVGFHRNSKIKPKSFLLEIDSDSDQSNTTYLPKSKASMRAQQVIEGGDVTRHAANVDGVFRRPRVVAQGPTQSSRINSLSDTPKFYQDGFKEILMTGSSDQIVDIPGFRIDHEKCVIRLNMLYSFFYNYQVKSTSQSITDAVQVDDLDRLFSMQSDFEFHLVQLDSDDFILNWDDAESNAILTSVQNQETTVFRYRHSAVDVNWTNAFTRKFLTPFCFNNANSVIASLMSYEVENTIDETATREGHYYIGEVIGDVVARGGLSTINKLTVEFDFDNSIHNRDLTKPFAIIIRSKELDVSIDNVTIIAPETPVLTNQFLDINIPFFTVETIGRT